MKVLLDEGMPHPLRGELRGHDVFTVSYMGWKGKKNGELLALADEADFDVLLTPDQAIPNQQNLGRLKRVGVVILMPGDMRMRSLRPLALHILTAISDVQPGEVIRIGSGGRL